MLGGSCSIELSVMILTEDRNPEETEDHNIRVIKGCIQLKCFDSH